jgi:hypothetical protein
MLQENPTTIDPPALEQRAERSPAIDQLAQALNKAQGALEGAEKNAKGHKHEYADLTEVWRVARPVLAKNGLAVLQIFDRTETGTVLITILTHESGQFVESRLPLMAVTDYHALGSAVTYSRRYSLAAILGISNDSKDDDAQGAMPAQDSPSIGKRASYPQRAKAETATHEDGRPRAQRAAPQATTTPAPEPVDDLDDEATKIAKSVPGCIEFLKANKAWNEGNETVSEFARANVVKQGVEGMTRTIADLAKGEA